MAGYDNRLKTFDSETGTVTVEFVDRYEVAEGVVCETYNFSGDDSRDLALVHMRPNKRTPRQKVMLGDLTVEGWVSGVGEFEVVDANGESLLYSFGNGQPNQPVNVNIGETIQWRTGDGELIFYEICEPKYSGDRFVEVEE